MFYKKVIQPFLKIAGIASKRWWDKDPFMQSAVIAYYSIFSLPGLLVIVTSVGAEFTRAYADHFSGKIPPDEIAVKDDGKVTKKHP